MNETFLAVCWHSSKGYFYFTGEQFASSNPLKAKKFLTRDQADAVSVKIGLTDSSRLGKRCVARVTTVTLAQTVELNPENPLE